MEWEAAGIQGTGWHQPGPRAPLPPEPVTVSLAPAAANEEWYPTAPGGILA